MARSNTATDCQSPTDPLSLVPGVRVLHLALTYEKRNQRRGRAVVKKNAH